MPISSDIQPLSRQSALDASEPRIARQPIVDQRQVVVGYELYDRAYAAGEHTSDSDAALLVTLLSLVDATGLTDRKTIFINCTHHSLDSDHLEIVQSSRVVLEVPTLHGSDRDLIRARLPVLTDLRRRSFRLALGHTVLTPGYEEWLALASYIKIDMTQVSTDQLAPMLRFARMHSGAEIIAEKVETEQTCEALLRLGVRLFQGHWFATPVILPTHKVRPAQANILQLINLVQKQAEVSDIEEVLKRDPTLSFTMLRYLNASGFGLSAKVTSFRHAVMMLGMKRLFRWSALLMATSRSGEVGPAVGATAVVRGRLMELLAADLLSVEERDNAFVVGIFSLLDTMLGMPMKEALDGLALPESITDALLHKKGLFAPLLTLAQACESGDEGSFKQAAHVLKLSDRQINEAHLEALNWAETLGE